MLKQQQERILVGRLFKELVVLVNGNAGTASELMEIGKSGPLPKHPTLNKRKSKLPKLKESLEPDDAKSQTHEQVELKNNKKYKCQPKQPLHQEEEKVKQLIFSDYQKVMRYRVHEDPREKHCGGSDAGQRSKKNFSIMQNITITINPNAKQ